MMHFLEKEYLLPWCMAREKAEVYMTFIDINIKAIMTSLLFSFAL